MKFTPRPHQVIAIDAIVKELSTSHRATAVMACGSGKTLVALWAAEKMNVKTILVLLPSLALIAQVFKEWKQQTKWFGFSCLCVCSDKTVTDNDDLRINLDELDFEVTTRKYIIEHFLSQNFSYKLVFSTYQSCDLLPKDYTFDLGIFDEAHKTAGREDKLFSYALSDKNVNIAKRLFLTATPRHCDINKTDGHPVFSMDDEAVYGKICYRLSFSDAVKQDIICGYKIIISTITMADVNRELINSGVVDIKKKTLYAKNIADSLALINAVKENNIKKVFTFHKTINMAKLFTASMKTFCKKYKSSTLVSLHISGDMNSTERKTIINDFKTAPLAVISNARCLTEGVDVPAVDMVAFMSPKKSQINIIQAAGRAMRKFGNKQQGYILIPLLLESNNQENLEEALSDTQYNETWNVLSALQEYDDELAEVISSAYKSRDCGERVNYERLNKKINIIGIRSKLSFEAIRNAIATTIVSRLMPEWDKTFEKLLAFKEKHGHVDVTPSSNEKSLWFWIKNQRKKFNKKILSKERIDKLNSLGFVWSVIEDSWYKKLDLLLSFKEKHGHINISRPNAHTSTKLSWLASNLRHSFKKNTLAQYKIDKLNSIGFSWDLQDLSWNENFEKLLIYKEKHGNSDIRQLSSSLSISDRLKLYGQEYMLLSYWASRQRRYFSRGTLSQERIDKLNSIGFDWNLKKTTRVGGRDK